MLSFTNDILRSGHSQIVEKEILQKMFSSEEIGPFKDAGIFKPVKGQGIHNKEVVLLRENGPCHYTAFFEDDAYVFEPEENEKPPIRQKKLTFDLGEVSRENVLRSLAEKNGYSFLQSTYFRSTSVLYVGEKEVGGHKMAWIHCIERTDFNELATLFPEVQKYGADYLVVSQFEDLVFDVDHNNSKIAIADMGQALLLNPGVYLKFFTSKDVKDLVDLAKYPVFVDVEEKFVFFFGRKLNLTPNTNLYQFLYALLGLPSRVTFRNDVFCRDWYQAPGKEESYKELSYRTKELRRQLKRVFPHEPELLEFFSKSLDCKVRGHVKCDIPADSVFWWPAKPSL